MASTEFIKAQNDIEAVIDNSVDAVDDLMKEVEAMRSAVEEFDSMTADILAVDYMDDVIAAIEAVKVALDTMSREVTKASDTREE